jgi:hypothetical protein
MRELQDGVVFWRSRKWPTDFHNTEYAKWAQQNPNGDFTTTWWQDVQLPRLQAWIATRGSTHTDLTARFKECAKFLSAEWRECCLPHREHDISMVTWDEVQGFPGGVAKIKPTKTLSPVFPSKFCHFLLPKVFPIVDNKGLGNRWPTYESYFRSVQDEWESTDPATRTELVAELTRLIKMTGQQVFPGFPEINKIVELRLMGPTPSQHKMSQALLRHQQLRPV